MSRRAWRVMLVVGLAGVVALAGAQIWRLDRDRGRELAEAQAFDAVAERLLRAVLDARASERAYVATGQGFAFWKPRVDQELQQVRDDLATLKTHATTDVTKVDAALEAFADVTRLEQRIAEHAAAGRLPHASDLIFADGLQASIALEHAADALIDTHQATRLATRSQARWQELALTGLIAAAGLLAALLLVPLPQSQSAADEDAEAARAAAEETDTAGGLSLRPKPAAAAAGTGLRDLRLASAGASGGDTASGMTGAGTRGDGSTTGSRRGPGGSATSTGSHTRGAAGASGGSASADRDRGFAENPTAGGRHARGEGHTAGDTMSGASAGGSDLRLASSGSGATSSSGADTRTTSTGRWSPSSASAASPAAASTAASPTGPASTSASPAPGAGALAALAANGEATSSALEGAAALCSALAQASNGQELDALLPHMARQLDAIGLIVWLKDEEGHALKAALSHGYPDYTLTTLAAIDPESQNATARAARLAEPQIVPAAGSTPGALVVPMLTAAGCVGVVSIELPAGREQDANTSALARIFAAQLAMLTA